MTLAPAPVVEGPGTIPPFVHMIWVGGDAPQWVRQSRRNWERQLDGTGIELRFWDDARIAAVPPLARTVEIAAAKQIAPRGLSNILRAQIVSFYGGIYVDCDCLLIGPLDDWVGQRAGYVFATERSAKKQLTMECSTYGFPPAHPFLAECLSEAAHGLVNGIRADFHLAGSRTFRTVWNRGGHADMEVHWTYQDTLDRQAKDALASIDLADLASLRRRLGPLPIVHVGGSQGRVLLEEA